MGIQDLIITPIYLILLYLFAYWVRPFVTNSQTKKYFIPALTLKFIGAISLGIVYQFYYDGGDTFNFWEHGSKWIWEAFMNEPTKGVKLMFSNGVHESDTYNYSQNIWYFKSHTSLFIIKIAAVFDLFTYGTYSSTALLFASFSFSGVWALYFTFHKLHPSINKYLAGSIFFIPSLFFWGSGILKDSITLGALGWVVFAFFNIIIFKNRILSNLFLLIFFSWVIYSIKIYILLCFIIGAVTFSHSTYINRIKTTLGKIILTPFVVTIIFGSGYFMLVKVSEDDSRYALSKIAQTAKITAYDIRYGWGARNGDNSGYTLGELDGTFGSLLRLAPRGINVSLFRPYLWEINSVLMLFASIESTLLLLLTILVIFRSGLSVIKKFQSPTVLFCLTFSLIFAFAVGVSTFNFGSLVRYKMPLIPFYLIGLTLISKTHNK